MADFIDLLRNALADGRSAAALSDDLGVARSQVSRWLKGQLPEDRMLTRLAPRLGVSIEELREAVAETRGRFRGYEDLQALTAYVEERIEVLMDRTEAMLVMIDRMQREVDDDDPAVDPPRQPRRRAKTARTS